MALKGKGNMRYKSSNGNEYILVKNKVIVRGGKESNVYYFVGEDVYKQKQKIGWCAKEVNKLPEGYEIIEEKKSGGFPLVRKKK